MISNRSNRSLKKLGGANTPIQAPDACKGLFAKNQRLHFRDSLGGEHDLTNEPLLNTFEASKELRCHPETLLRKVRAAEIYPVVFVNTRVLQIYRCAMSDYRYRMTVGAGRIQKGSNR